jgi:hypothetical protein
MSAPLYDGVKRQRNAAASSAYLMCIKYSATRDVDTESDRNTKAIMLQYTRDPALAIGAALQHTRQQLCRRIDALAAQPDAGFAAGWDALVAATEAAFRHEETVMELVGYPGLAAHRAENARTLSALHHVTPGVASGEFASGRAALAALAAIVSAHRYRTVTVAAATHVRGHAAGYRKP